VATPEEPNVVRALGELPSLMVSTDAIDQVMWETAMLAVRADDAVDACGMTVLRNGRPVSVMPDVATHNAIEQLQYEGGAGPVRTALETHRTALVSNTATDTRWPEFSRAAAEQNVAAAVSLPMLVGDQLLGAVNLYSRQPGAFDRPPVLGELIADLAATGLWCMLKHADRQQMTEQLQQALTSRADIDQAKGILMSRHGCTPDEAFDLLRRDSQHRNVKLRAAAAELVAAVSGRSGTPGS